MTEKNVLVVCIQKKGVVDNLLDWKTPEGYEMCKELFNRKLYYGGWDAWCRDYGMPICQMPEFIKELEKELELMATEIQRNNPALVEQIEKEEKTQNPKGTIVSWFLQEHERRILEKVLDFLKKKKFIVKNNAVLCYDGIQILENNRFNDVVIKELELQIHKTTGFDMKFKVKPFDELPYLEALDKIEIPYTEPEDDYRLVEDDKQAADLLYEELKDRLKYCNYQLFSRKDHIWTANEKATRSALMDYVMSSNVKTTDSKGNIKPFAQNYTCASHIVEAIINSAMQTPEDSFYQKFHTSTKGKLCFQDEVLDIIKNKFHLWDSEYLEENPVHSTILIERPFHDAFNAPNQETIEEVEEKIFDAIFGEQKERALHFLSRALAGHTEDKDWAIFLGNRDCGKGVLNDFIKNAIGNYTITISADHFIAERFNQGGDCKKMSWSIDLQFVRFAATQEIKYDSSNKNLKMDGVMIKAIHGGGDPIEARKNTHNFLQSQHILSFLF
jgi:hypothetical protein